MDKGLGRYLMGNFLNVRTKLRIKKHPPSENIRNNYTKGYRMIRAKCGPEMQKPLDLPNTVVVRRSFFRDGNPELWMACVGDSAWICESRADYFTCLRIDGAYLICDPAHGTW